MGKRKKEEKVAADAEESNEENAQMKKHKRVEQIKETEKPKKNNVIGKGKNDAVKASNDTKKSTELGKKINQSNSCSESSSSSDSESENKNDKKSDSDSDSDSESSDSSRPSTPLAKNEKAKVVEPVKNSVVNLSPMKSYNPPPKSSSSDSYHSDTEEEDKKRRKKQKKLLKIQLSKKTKKVAQSRLDVKPEIYDDLDIKDEEDDGIDNIASNNDDVPDWPESDYYELIRRMEAQLPAKDNLKFDSRAVKLDWNAIAFADYSASDCHDVWNRISKRIRRFRLLSEMLSDAKDWVTKPWTNFYRGSKKNRHPDMPSRPLSTYMIYYLEHKDKVAQENPGLEMTQVSKIISEMYKNLTTKERDKYTEMAAKERANFDEKLSEFYKEHPDMVPQPQSKSSAREVATKGPRKASTPFKLFFQEQLKKYGDNETYDRKAVEEAAKEAWKNMSDKKKLIFIDWSLEDNRRYMDELKVYTLEHPDFVPPISKPLKSILNKDERTIKERLSGKPVKPPNSAYSLYSRVMLQSDPQVKKLPPKERMAEISKKWKELSDAQKARYEEKVRELQDNYKLEFASYLEGLSPEERDEELQQHQPKRKAAIKEEKPVKRKSKAVTNVKPPVLCSKGSTGLCLYRGEPEPPPVKVFDLFLKTFLAEKPAGTTIETRLKEAPKYWEILPDSKKEFYRKKLADLKKKYIKDYEVFLKSLSPDELKEFSVLKHNAKKIEEAHEQLNKVNGRLSDSNEESDEDEKKDSTSDSDSDDSDSGKSTKSSSSSEDSE